MKKHPLKIEYTEDDGATDYYTYFSKGEQDAKAFCEKLKQEYDIEASPEKVKQAWWRYVPVKYASYDLEILQAKPFSRGAFFVTYVVA
ncbi:MAG: hypothetical protein UV64_C0007G0023 [Parcubacteria group bacterium GW2011_GWC1_43_11b]|nr:MAG: hypothetical protein UV64_C0007G0023 [Parcubacteria group bacterium GW2011_GWC1_43_11b]